MRITSNRRASFVLVCGSTATSAPPAATRLLGIAELTEILAQLDRPVTDAGNGPPEVTALHLTWVLVAAAEQQAVAAEIALARANARPGRPRSRSAGPPAGTGRPTRR
jgi:hypothetical protein